MSHPTEPQFNDLGLPDVLSKTLDSLGYQTPTPIQAETIPLMLNGRDLVGQAQTGTGKTAAFALPALANLDASQKKPQVLVLAPTRELAIQVANAFERYGQGLSGFNVLPIYGGQEYGKQIRALTRGVQVVVGTPGRVMDHVRRGTLQLDELRLLVLDEGDEMLRMGFIDDVEWILEKTPDTRQIALFSATMPPRIARIADRYLKQPETVRIRNKTTTAATINQRVCVVHGGRKYDALSRILEAETVDAAIVFVRTRAATVEVATHLEAQGFAAAPLNGDVPQAQRERTIDRLKNRKLDILVATDVAARGLDVDRISHVFNVDIPYDSEAYVHRIGRTGRAGRAGNAILFVTQRERRMQQVIERATGQKMQSMELPTNAAINQSRMRRFTQRIAETLASEELNQFVDLLDTFRKEADVPPLKIAAALAHMAQGDRPLLYSGAEAPSESSRKTKKHEQRESSHASRKPFGDHPSASRERSSKPFDTKPAIRPGKTRAVPAGMERFRLDVGADDGVKPSNVVGAIANEAGIDSEYIGHILINQDHSLVDLPEGMPPAILKDLRKVWICGKPMRLAREQEAFTGQEPKTRNEKRIASGQPPKAKTRHRDIKNKGKPVSKGKKLSKNRIKKDKRRAAAANG